MKNVSLIFYLTNKIESEISLQEISAYLKAAKEEGLKKAEVIDYLNHLRSDHIAVERDDRILEILDIAEGFCSKRFKVW